MAEYIRVGFHLVPGCIASVFCTCKSVCEFDRLPGRLGFGLLGVSERVMHEGDVAFDCSFWTAMKLRFVCLQVVTFVSNSRFKRDYKLEAYPTGVQLTYWMLLAHFLLCSSRSSIVDGISSSSSSFLVESKGVSWRKIYLKAKLV